MAGRLQRLRERTNGYTVTPEQYVRVAYVALGALTLIVLTGAAVRLTGSGLGCPPGRSATATCTRRCRRTR